MMQKDEPKKRRVNKGPWKRRIGDGVGFDSAYTERVRRAQERGQYTPPKETTE